MNSELIKLILESNLINFSIVAIVLVWALLKFIPQATRKQSELIRKEIQEVEAARKQAENSFKELEAKLLESKQAAKNFLEEAKSTAKQLRVQILEESKAEIEQMKKLAENDLEQQKIIIMRSIKQKVIDAAFKLTEESVKSEDNRRQIESSLRASLEKNLGAITL